MGWRWKRAVVWPIRSTRTDPYFDFIGADLTRSYNPAKVAGVTRQFVWLRPDLFVIHDRVAASDPAYPKRFLLHGQDAFSQVGGAWQVDHAQGRLFMQTCCRPAPR